MELREGTYKHYKGTLYIVKGMARHSETEEWLVIYHSVAKPTELWVRPYQMFVEQLLIDGSYVPRFDFIQ